MDVSYGMLPPNAPKRHGITIDYITIYYYIISLATWGLMIFCSSLTLHVLSPRTPAIIALISPILRPRAVFVFGSQVVLDFSPQQHNAFNAFEWDEWELFAVHIAYCQIFDITYHIRQSGNLMSHCFIDYTPLLRCFVSVLKRLVLVQSVLQERAMLQWCRWGDVGWRYFGGVWGNYDWRTGCPSFGFFEVIHRFIHF